MSTENHSLEPPILDLHGLRDDQAAVEWVAKASTFCKTMGDRRFVYIKNHGVNMEVIEEAFQQSKNFFSLPQAVKERYRMVVAKGLGGYVPPGNQTLDLKNVFELRESYDAYGTSRNYPDDDCPAFGQAMLKLEEDGKVLTKRLLRLLATGLKLGEYDFVNRVKYLDDPTHTTVPNLTTLRSLWYPPIKTNVPDDSMRIGDHTDFGYISLIYQDGIGGLEILGTDGVWMKVQPIPDIILAITGDLMEILSTGLIPAAHHRVLIPESESKRMQGRQSIIHFVTADNDVVVENLVKPPNPEWKPISSEEYFMKRLHTSFRY